MLKKYVFDCQRFRIPCVYFVLGLVVKEKQIDYIKYRILPTDFWCYYWQTKMAPILANIYKAMLEREQTGHAY